MSFPSGTSRPVAFIFECTELPVAGEVYNGDDLILAVEGALVIKSGGLAIFNCPNILLVELAAHFSRWLKKLDLQIDAEFYYASMDYEEEPVLSFTPAASGGWNVASVWQEYHTTVPFEELRNGVNRFIEELKMEVLEASGFDIRGRYGADQVEIR